MWGGWILERVNFFSGGFFFLSVSVGDLFGILGRIDVDGL